LVSPTRTALREHLDGVGNMATVLPDQFRKHYDALKLYMMMCDRERLDVDWASSRLIQKWVQTTVRGGEAKGAMLANVKHYILLMKRGEIPMWKPDKAAISRAQTVLLRAPRLERLYEILVQDANQEVPPIRRQDIFYGAVAPFVTSKQELTVEGAYSKQGWEKVRQLLGAQQARLVDEGWVLGQDRKMAKGELDKQIVELKSLYFTRYTQAWADFLADMEVRQPDSATSSLDELQTLSEPMWAYQRMLRTLADNVVLDVEEDEDTLADDLLDRAKKVAEKKLVERKLMDAGAPQAKKTRQVSPVEKAFQPLVAFAVPADSKSEAPTGLTQYQQLLAKLVGVLTDLRDAETGPDTAKLATEFEQAFRTATALLTTQDGFTRPLLSPYLMRPITGAWSGVVRDAGGAASGLWETTVWDKWQATLANRYPFTNSPKDAKIEDFSEFFRPETGLLWSFYQQNLGGSLKRVGDDFRATRRFQSSMNFTNSFTSNCLQRGAKITSAVFPPKATDPIMAFDINLHSVSPDVAEVHLDIDGAVKVYKNTPEEWLSAVWPAKEAKSRGARVRVRGYSGLDERIVRDGDFGLFRLLDAADKIEVGTAGGKPDGAATVVATWMLRSQGAYFKLDIRPARQVGTPNTQLFRGYECPRVIASAGN
jgi:type VI secretion system protein ImpL